MFTATVNWTGVKCGDAFRESHSATVFMCLVIGLKLAGLLKLKVKVKFTLEQATNAQRWSTGIAPHFL
jgi:hypothetical protein